MNNSQSGVRYRCGIIGNMGGRLHPRISAMALALSLALGGIAATALPAAALAQGAVAQHSVSVPAGPLRDALDALASQSGITVLYSPDLVAGKTTRGLSGRYAPAEALRQLLKDSGLQAQGAGEATFTLRRAPARQATPKPATREATATATPEKPEIKELEGMTITGTRIRGGSTPSPVIGISALQIQEEGFSDLGQVIRNIPQNFSGGQNPGVLSGNITGAGVANQNITGGSGLNLRGLGSDATLTLLNGRRMAYGGFVPSVDISAIPVDAVQRIEIVADGASAIYGSDAVGGVANVILRRDYEGVTVGARYGGATDGGMTTREYTVTAGANWSSGGLIATYKNASVAPIYSNRRDYTDQLVDPATIFPGSDLQSGLLSIHQSLGDFVELRMDAFRTERDQLHLYNWSGFHSRVTPETTSTLVSPSIEFLLPRDWTLTVGGAWGEDEHIQYRVQQVIATGVSSIGTNACYCNESFTYEAGAEGPLFTLPAGDARLAIGAGYRKNEFLQTNNNTGAVVIDGEEKIRFAYAEVNLPLISANQNVPGVRRLALTAAVRGKDYDSFGSVTTPKFGLIYDPNADFTLKASWGKSFKAPTLYQRSYDMFAYIHPPSYFGGSGYAADAQVLWSAGGNPDLVPERARTWTASLAFHPETVPGLDMELTWFDIDYTDRVVQPITNYGQALNIPSYVDFIDYSPTAEKQAALLATANSFGNYVGAPYDPSKVVAIVHTEYANVARQEIKGLDLSGSYRFDLAAGQMTIRGSASWIDSTQQTSSVQNPYDLSGTLFNPAKISGRIGAIWSRDGFSTSVFGNYKSGVTDTVNDDKGGSFTTFDAILRYSTSDLGGALSGLDFTLSAQNLFDRSPPFYTPNAPLYVAPYDPTNYSAIGRFLSVSVSKRF